MKQFQLKQPQVVNVVGLSFEGDYLVLVSNGEGTQELIQVVPKPDFEAKYEPVPVAAPAEQAKTEAAPTPTEQAAPAPATQEQASPNAQHAV